MSLITMGYGHTTVITMGLGRFLYMATQQVVRGHYGDVSFEKVDTGVEMEETPVDITIEESSQNIEVTNG